jgi:hypothetical protein
MADVKISGLPASTTPLAGTEVLPIVQSGVTKQVAVSDLTAARSVAARAITLTQTTTGSGGFKIAAEVLASDYPSVRFLNTTANDGFLFGWDTDHITITTNTTSGVAGLERLAIFKTSGDVKVNTGNLVIGTSGKGIDFSATAGAGTSELLNDYEEGTWAPTQGAGLTVVGAFSSSGTYTKVGRQVTVIGVVNGATSVAIAANTILCGGLPFTSSTDGIGSLSNAVASQTGIVFVSTTNLFSSVVAATPAIYFTATYFV